MANVPIPDFLKHLKVAENGYPIPFFVAYKEGKPDFRLLDANKYKHCITQQLCSICGKKNIKGAMFFITGPQGLKNGISTDAPMHRCCAEYSLQVCPHLHLEKATRRDKDIAHLQNATQVIDKPPFIYLVCAKSFQVIRNPINNGILLKYSAVRSTEYTYKDGKLQLS